MLSKLVKGQKSQENCRKEIKMNISGLNKKVDSYATTIKELKQQFGQMPATWNQRKSGTLPSNTMQNSKNDSHCQSITSRSGKAIIDPLCLRLMSKGMIMLRLMRHRKQSQKSNLVLILELRRIKVRERSMSQSCKQLHDLPHLSSMIEEEKGRREVQKVRCFAKGVDYEYPYSTNSQMDAWI